MHTQSPVVPARRGLVVDEQQQQQQAHHHQQRQLTGSTFNFTAAAEAVYSKYMVDIDDVMHFLAVFHDFDEMLLTAWADSGIEEALETLYDAIDVYDNVWDTITNIFQASLGDFLEFAKSIIDKLGEFLCDSGDAFTDEAAATSPPPDCGIVGQVRDMPCGYCWIV